MELRHIRYFLALVEEANFTRAAARVGIAQSPFSAQIRDLEREVGTPLFHRVPQGAELTAAGIAFRDTVAGMPDVVRRAMDAAQRAGRGETGALNVGFTASAAFNAVVPNAIRAFRHASPGVLLRLEEANTARLVEGLRGGSLDVVFLRPIATGIEDVRRVVLSREPLVVALPASHPAVALDEVPLERLADDPLLLVPRSSGPPLYDAIVGAFRDRGVEPRLGQSAPQIASVINLVAAALGITLVPACMTQIAVSGVAYRPIVGVAPETEIVLARRRGDTSPVVRNFVSHATAQIYKRTGNLRAVQILLGHTKI